MQHFHPSTLAHCKAALSQDGEGRESPAPSLGQVPLCALQRGGPGAESGS